MNITQIIDQETAIIDVTNRLAIALTEALGRDGKASLVLTGGQTIRPFLPAIAALPLPWNKISVILSDERWVDVNDNLSNEAQLRAHMFDHMIVKPRYIGLKTSDNSPRVGIDILEPTVRDIMPFSAVLLSIGEDGHVASLFPQEPETWYGTHRLLVSTEARGGRISLGPAALNTAKYTMALLKKPRTLDEAKMAYLRKIFDRNINVIRH